MWLHPDPVGLSRTAQSVLAAIYLPPPQNPEFHFVLVIKTQVLKHSIEVNVVYNLSDAFADGTPTLHRVRRGVNGATGESAKYGAKVRQYYRRYLGAVGKDPIITKILYRFISTINFPTVTQQQGQKKKRGILCSHNVHPYHISRQIWVNRRKY